MNSTLGSVVPLAMFQMLFRLSFQPSLLFYSKRGKLCAKRQTLHKIASLSGKTKWIRKLFDQCAEKKDLALSLRCTILTSQLSDLERLKSIFTWNTKSNQANLWIILNIRKLVEHLQGTL